jgi:hypothetical protein
VKKITLIIILCLTSVWQLHAQVIPYGLSKDSITIPEIFNLPNDQSFYLYKPLSYDSLNSPIWFVIHGTGGTGAGTINNLSDIAERRGALMVGLTLGAGGTTMSHQTSLIHSLDTNPSPTSIVCSYRLPGTIVMRRVYNYLTAREGRTFIPCYLSGFSAGGQWVSRYMLIRQAYPDSVPIQMALSMSPIGYSFPTDTFLGVAQPWVCGMIMPQSLFISDCIHSYNIYGWNCNEHIVQYYNENYAVCVGDQDLASQLNGGCYDITGATRLDRARTFFAFCDSNAITRGTSLNWQYAEIPGAGHDEYACFQSKWLPTDTSTIAERILFETPYQPVAFTAPVANFYPDSITIQANDTVFFTNTSINSTSYYWEFGDSTYATSTLVNPYHVYSIPGTYSVELTAINATGCDNWYKRKHFIHVINSVGIAEQNSTEINVAISPNPTHDILKVKLKTTLQAECSWLITDLSGRSLIKGYEGSKNEFYLPTKDLLTGVYILRLNSTSGQASLRFVKD